MRARTLPALLTGVALIGAACASDGNRSAVDVDDGDGDTGAVVVDDPSNPPDPDDPSDGDGRAGAGAGPFPRLAPFADCSAFLAHIKAEAAERVGPYGLDMYPGYWFEDDLMLDMAVEEAAEAAADMDDGSVVSNTAPAAAPAEEPADEPAGDDSGGDGDFTGTNVQEAGVDEADIVKTDGERILVVSDGVLSYIDVSGDEPVRRGQLSLAAGWGHEMFFRGDRAFVITNGGPWGGPMPIDMFVTNDASTDAEAEFAVDEESGEMYHEYHGPAAMIMEIDLSDPSNLAIVSTLRVEGQYLSARAIGDRVRLAVTSFPSQLPWVYPQSETGEDRATATNREIIEESTLEDWLPEYSIDSADGSRTGQLLACERMHHPAEFAGFEAVSVIDLDLADGIPADLAPQDTTGVLASGQTVYSSTDRFYVASTEWAGADLPADEREEWIEEFATQIHAFAIAPGEPTEYVASGSVPGSLLNQFSMDEHEGFLRVLTTTGTPWGGQDLSETGLTVFEEQDDRLVQVGFVGGLGEGEQLYSARLMGDIGFAVTFRQIDPFYVLDLSDPRDPKVTGELKIPGVSTYLHRVGEDFVLGVGQDATEEGMTTGLKLSLFDVSDPANPTETDVWTLTNAHSSVEWDHRAFQMLGSTAIVPVESWNEEFDGVVLFDIVDSINEIGRVSHEPIDAAPSSDCRPITADDLTQDSSELWYMATDNYGYAQLCGADDVGGWGDHMCERIPIDEIRFWYWDEAAAETDLERMGAAAGDRIELCWPESYGQHRIVRSLIIGDTLWTVSNSIVQANLLDGLAVEHRVPIR